MNHEEWIGKTLGEFIDYVSSNYSYGTSYYNINRSIGLDEIIGLCIYNKDRFRDKYYSKVIYKIESNGDCSYSILTKEMNN